MNWRGKGPFRLADGMRGVGNVPVSGVVDADGVPIINCGTGKRGRATAAHLVSLLNGRQMDDPVLQALRDALGAIDALTTQVEQMRGMFGDSDGAIAEALEAGRDAERAGFAVLAGAKL